MNQVALPATQTESVRSFPKRNSGIRKFWKRFSRNRLAVFGLIVIIVALLSAIFANVIEPYNPVYSDFMSIYKAPSWQHWLGTDSNGRDMLSRILGGLRSAFEVGFGAEVVELTLGLMLGAIAGYLGGLTDNLLMRLVDVVYAFPSFLFSIILVVILGHNIWAILIAISATSWVGMARIVRSQVLKIRQAGFIEASRGMGASFWRIILRYIIPNSMGPILVAVTFGIPANMMAEAGLSIVGLGIEPPTPDLGELIIEGQSAMFSYPYLLLGPVIIFALTLISFALVGDGLRDVFDVKSNRR